MISSSHRREDYFLSRSVVAALICQCLELFLQAHNFLDRSLCHGAGTGRRTSRDGFLPVADADTARDLLVRLLEEAPQGLLGALDRVRKLGMVVEESVQNAVEG